MPPSDSNPGASPAGEPAAASAPAAAALSDDELYAAACAVLDTDTPPQTWAQQARTLLITLALFAAAGWLFGGDSIRTLALFIVPVLILHELGHYVGMVAFGYRRVTMFFIPFFGAAVSGVKHGAPVWQHVIMLLLGPLPGLLLALALRLWLGPDAGGWLGELIPWLVIINAFNLLPIMPLDGGRIVDALFFARQPWLAAGFQLLTAAGLAGLAWLLWLSVPAVIFTLLAVVMLTTVVGTHRTAVEARSVRAAPLALPNDFEKLSDGERRALFDRAIMTTGIGRTPAAIAGKMRWLYETMVTKPPRLATRLTLVAIYAGGIWVAIEAGQLRDIVPALLPVPADVATARAMEQRADQQLREWTRRRVAGGGASAQMRDEALDQLRSAIALRERHLAANPGWARWQQEYAARLEMLAFREEKAAGLETLRKALGARAALAAGDPTATGRLAEAHERIGKHLGDMTRHDEALAHLTEARAIRVRQVARRPGDDRLRRSLAAAEATFGEQLTVMGRRAEAAAAFQRSLDLARQLAVKNAEDADALATAHQSLARLAVSDGRGERVAEHALAALAAFEQWAQAAPAATYRHLLAIDLGVELGEALVGLQRTTDAAEVFRAALQAEERRLALVVAERTQKGADGAAEADALSAVALAALRARDPARALAAAEQGLALAPAKLDLAARRAHALMLLGRTEEARSAYLAPSAAAAASAERPPTARWAKIVLDDLALLKRAGLAHPLMDEVEAGLARKRP